MVLPSSRFVAREITKNIQAVSDDPMAVLEVGAGTGAFTSEIVKRLRPNDRLDVIELDQTMCDFLKWKFKNYKNVFIHCQSFFEWKTDRSYDFIVSALPFNSFSGDMVAAAVERYETLAKPNAYVSYISYPFLPSLKKFFLSTEGKAAYEKSMAIATEFRKKHRAQTTTVWLNIPPANVYHMRIKKAVE